MFITVTYLLRSLQRIVKRSCIYILQLVFVNIFIAPIWFICFTTMNVIYLRRSVRDVEVLKCCSKWAANEYEFFHSWVEVGDWRNDHTFFKSNLSVTYINSVTHGAFYFVDYTSRSAFTFVKIFYVDFIWKITVTFSIH